MSIIKLFQLFIFNKIIKQRGQVTKLLIAKLRVEKICTNVQGNALHYYYFLESVILTMAI